jgi:hypothetical protein
MWVNGPRQEEIRHRGNIAPIMPELRQHLLAERRQFCRGLACRMTESQHTNTKLREVARALLESVTRPAEPA